MASRPELEASRSGKGEGLWSCGDLTEPEGPLAIADRAFLVSVLKAVLYWQGVKLDIRSKK